MRHWEIMKRCCPLWQVNGFSIKRRKKNSPHTESQSCNESMKSASFEKRQHFFQRSFSLKRRLFRDGTALRGLPGFICSDAVRGVQRQRSVTVSLLSLVLWLPDTEVCSVLLLCRYSPQSLYTSDITVFSSASSLLQKHQGREECHAKIKSSSFNHITSRS